MNISNSILQVLQKYIKHERCWWIKMYYLTRGYHFFSKGRRNSGNKPLFFTQEMPYGIKNSSCKTVVLIQTYYLNFKKILVIIIEKIHFENVSG